MLPWFCSWKRGELACSGGESMAARRSRKVETACVSSDREKKGPRNQVIDKMCVLMHLLKELCHSFSVWCVLMLSQESG